MRDKSIQTGLQIYAIFFVGCCLAIFITWVSDLIAGLDEGISPFIGLMLALFIWGFSGIVVIKRKDVTVYYIPGIIRFRLTGKWATGFGLFISFISWGLLVLVCIKFTIEYIFPVLGMER